jgi:hypothetical protein
MAHPNSLKNLIPYKPGQSGNVHRGVGMTPEYLKHIKSVSYIEAVKLISKYARMSYEELQATLEAKTAPVLELSIASIFSNSIRRGDFARLNFLLDRCIGKVKEEQVDENSTRDELRKLSLNELMSIVKTNLPETPEG